MSKYEKNWKIVDSNGKIIDYFHSKLTAIEWVKKMRSEYFGKKFKVQKNDGK